MITEEIRAVLFSLRDETYRAFQAKLIPTVAPDLIIGVRTPALKKMAKELSAREDLSDFLEALPHAAFDENQLHAFLISEIRDYDQCLSAVERFLPFIDNWATCDQLSPKVFKKHRSELIGSVKNWITSDKPFTVRFAVGMLMEHFLGESFDPLYPKMVAAVRSEEYYVKMMVAWYFATALAKQYDAVVPYLENRQLEPFIHNKTIQKAVESYRIPEDVKKRLKELRTRG